MSITKITLFLLAAIVSAHFEPQMPQEPVSPVDSSAPQMPQEAVVALGDEETLKHYNFVTRYSHSFALPETQAILQSESTKCGSMFGMAKDIFEGQMLNWLELPEPRKLMKAGAKYLSDDCRAFTGGYTWIRLRISLDERLCDIHVPIDLHKYAENGVVFNEHYGQEAVRIKDTYCYDDQEKLLAKVAEELKDSSVVDQANESDIVNMTKSQKIEKALIDDQFVEFANMFEEAEASLPQDQADKFKEKLQKIDSINNNESLKHSGAINTIVNEFKIIKNGFIPLIKSKFAPTSNDNKEEKQKPSIFSQLTHRMRVNNIWNKLFHHEKDEKDNTNHLDEITEASNDNEESQSRETEIKIDAPSEEQVDKKNFAPLNIEEEHAHHQSGNVDIAAEDNTDNNGDFEEASEPSSPARGRSTGSPINCDDAQKQKIISYINTEATKAQKTIDELYPENITSCTVKLGGGIKYSTVLEINDKSCYYNVSVNTGARKLYSDEDADKAQSMVSCRTEYDL